jgi:hypothetical protein
MQRNRWSLPDVVGVATSGTGRGVPRILIEPQKRDVAPVGGLAARVRQVCVPSADEADPELRAALS